MKCTFDALKVRSYVVMFKVIYGFVPFVIMLVCYTGVVVVVMLSSQRVRFSQRVAVADPGPPGRSRLIRMVRRRRTLKSELKVTKNAFLTCIGFAVCYLPSAIFGFVVTTREKIQSPLGISLVFLMWIGE